MRRRRWRRLAAAHGGERRRRGRRRQPKTASRARIRAQVGLGARARDGELSYGSWEAVWRPCIGARRREAARVVGARSDELFAHKRRGKQREKGAGVILTTTRISGGGRTRRGRNGTARRRRLRAPRELQWQRRRLGFAREGGGCGDLGSIGFQGDAGALYRPGPRPLACAPRRSAELGRRPDSVESVAHTGGGRRNA